MAIDSDIRDQAYQFFIQEALDLIQVIETELLTLQQDRNTAKIHSLMRAAHSIKGGAASVDLEVIKQIAHRLEDCFKALHHDDLTIDAALETLFLQAFDCLKNPLLDEIQTGYHDAAQAQAQAEPIFAALELSLEAFLGAESHLPSSIELGVDIARSIFEIDVTEGLTRLAEVLASPITPHELASELRAQAEVFMGISELLNLSGFGAIAQAAFTAASTHPAHAFAITSIALADFKAAQQAVLGGDRKLGGRPSEALLQWGDALPHTSTPETPGEMESLWGEPVAESVWAEPAHHDSTAEIEALWGEDPEGVTESVIAPAPDLEALWGEDPEGVTESSITPAPDLEMLWGEDPESDTPVEAAIAPVPDLEALWGEDPEPIAVSNTAPLPDLAMESIWGDERESQSDVEAIEEPDPLELPVLQQPWSSTLDAPESTEPQIETPAAETSSEIAPETTKTTEVQPIQDWAQAIATDFTNLPASDPNTFAPPISTKIEAASPQPAIATNPETTGSSSTKPDADNSNQLTVRVQLDRLEQMNNQLGELVINRNSLSLQNEQLQKTVQELLRRFSRFRSLANQLRDLSDQRLIATERSSHLDSQRPSTSDLPQDLLPLAKLQTEFDSLELDSYGELHLLMQSILEEIAQLEENTGDIGLLTKQSNQSLKAQRQMLSRLQEDLMWARMLPIGQVLNRFPRVLRDLAVQHHKLVDLKLSGTGVLVDKAAVEQLYSPLMHIVRNAFDHGIEPPDVRRQQGKHEQGKIEIRAYHRGSQTIIEVRDDGQGVNFDRIRERAIALDWIPAEQAATLSQHQLLELMFQPGFSTAKQVTELSGRGVGLDVVRSQLQALKGTVSVTSEMGKGTTFTLRIPLTLTVNKLLVCLVGSAALALPSDTIEEILVPKSSQVKTSGEQRFLYWRGELVPMVALSDVLEYGCPLPSTLPSQALAAAPTPADWALPLLMLRQGKQVLAIEVDRIVTEQELVIKPYGSVLEPPSYLYGCTTLGDGSLVPVLDGTGLFDQITRQTLEPMIDPIPTVGSPRDEVGVTTQPSRNKLTSAEMAAQSTILIVDDSIALRQTLALTLQKAGHHVLQARDGREALDQLQQNSNIRMVVCDVEMPNMNGFEFLSHRRQDAALLNIPVAMLTSRSSDKHRRLALHLGANAYFVKPYIEQEFLQAIAQIMQKKQAVSIS